MLRGQDMGLVLDFVPNHMGIDSSTNHWWRDVLENGPSSPYARYFDIDWAPVKPELRDKVLLPILGAQYGVVLERGELQIGYGDGALTLQYYERNLPLNPRQQPLVLGRNLDSARRPPRQRGLGPAGVPRRARDVVQSAADERA